MPPLVYIILLNWNNARDTIECLISLSDTTYKYKKILIVDNGSNDGSLTNIKEWCRTSHLKDDIQFLELGANLGFDGGNNKGIDFALKNNANYVLILNNDTLVPPETISNVVRTAEGAKNVGIIGVKTFRYPQKETVWFSGGEFRIFRLYSLMRGDNFTGVRPTGLVPGCFMLIPAAVLKAVGGFDTRYFLFLEDTDLSMRIKKAGYVLLVDCQNHIYHKVSSTMGGTFSPLSLYYLHRNRMLFLNKFLTGYKKTAVFFVYFLIFVPILLMYEFLQGHIKNTKWILLGYWDFLCHKTGKSARSFN